MKKFILPLMVLVATVGLVAAVLALPGSLGERLLGIGESYKAVTLTNGSSYFGKIRREGKDFVTLTDVFYLRAKTVSPADSSQRQLELVKLGSEIHGPEDSLMLNRRQIVSIQKLKPDSAVTAAIAKYYTGKSGAGKPDSAKKGKVNVSAE